MNLLAQNTQKILLQCIFKQNSQEKLRGKTRRLAQTQSQTQQQYHSAPFIAFHFVTRAPLFFLLPFAALLSAFVKSKVWNRAADLYLNPGWKQSLGHAGIQEPFIWGHLTTYNKPTKQCSHSYSEATELKSHHNHVIWPVAEHKHAPPPHPPSITVVIFSLQNKPN